MVFTEKLEHINTTNNQKIFEYDNRGKSLFVSLVYSKEVKKNNYNGTLSLIHGNKMFGSNSTFNIIPKVGEFYFFPNYLMHTAYPFSSKGERRSFSFNAEIDNSIANVFNNE